MNWMKAYLRKLLWRTLILGAIAGVWGAFLFEGALWLAGRWEPSWVELLPGAALGLGLGAALAPIDDLMGRFWHRILKGGLAGGALGSLVGMGAFGLLAALDAPESANAAGLSPVGGGLSWLLTALLLGAIAAAAGVGSGFGAGRWAKAIQRGLTGLVSGALVGLPVGWAVSALPGQPWVLLAGFAAWGAVVSWAIFWSEKRFVRHWLRVLTGPGEDNFYPLNSRRVTLGKLEGNDIPLPHYQEIFPFHCQIRWAADHYEIVDNEQGGVVFVNFRQAHEQVLKPVDLLKIGSALLQYGEAL